MNIDKKYLSDLKEILSKDFVETRNGRCKKFSHLVNTYDLSDGKIPLLQSKKVFWKSALVEILWIYQQQTNDVSWLHKNKVHIWDEWMMKDGTIGESYGWVIKNYNQVDDLLNNLNHNPQNRRMIVDLYQKKHISKGALPPCCFLTMWDVSEKGELNCCLVQRSGDMPLGVPFNMFQYSALVHIIAHCVGLKPGKLTHIINNAHIYENQIPGVIKQISRKNYSEGIPKFKINTGNKYFYSLDISNFEVENYTPLSGIKFLISV